MPRGSNAGDCKRLILEKSEANVIVEQHPQSQHFFRPYGGTKELLTNALRTCLWVDDGEVDQAIGIAPLGRIIEACRIYREGAGRDAQKAARKPHAFRSEEHTYEFPSLMRISYAVFRLKKKNV